MAVTLDGLATGFADGMFQSRHRLLLRSGRAGHVKDFLLQNRAVKIVHAVTQ